MQGFGTVWVPRVMVASSPWLVIPRLFIPGLVIFYSLGLIVVWLDIVAYRSVISGGWLSQML